MEWLTKIGAWGALGFIVSFGIITWLGEDLTTGGVVVIMALCIAIFLVIGGAVSFFTGGKD